MVWQSFEITSTNIASARYDDTSKTLEISFRNGGVYQYFDVPFQVWQAFKSAPSQGKYLVSNINGN